MRKAWVGLIALVIVGGFVLYMSSFTVRFTEAAVVTTFGQADANDVVTEPGLRFKWPTPIQTTTVYDTRARFLQTKSETQQTADDRQIIVEAFMTWKVKNPLVFYQRFRGSRGSSAREHYSAAASVLTGNLRSAMSEVSQFRLGELFASEPGASKLGVLEGNILSRVNGSVADNGVEVVAVGINSITLPQDTTREIFQRMSESRKRLAAKAESEGTALATAIRSEAEASAKRIREFARFRADQIRNRGEVEAAPFLTALNEEPALAVFLKQLEVLREGMGRRSTIVLPTTMDGLEMFTTEARDMAQRGLIPGSKGVAPSRPAEEKR